jgi:hypothetical protein
MPVLQLTIPTIFSILASSRPAKSTPNLLPGSKILFITPPPEIKLFSAL